AVEALAVSGADAVMIGRGAQGRPWLPGQIARYLATRVPQQGPSLVDQHRLIDGLYDEMLDHHGPKIGRRHARKHLGWALDQAAATAAPPPEVLKNHPGRVFPADNAPHG